MQQPWGIFDSAVDHCVWLFHIPFWEDCFGIPWTTLSPVRKVLEDRSPLDNPSPEGETGPSHLEASPSYLEASPSHSSGPCGGRFCKHCHQFSYAKGEISLITLLQDDGEPRGHVRDSWGYTMFQGDDSSKTEAKKLSPCLRLKSPHMPLSTTELNGNTSGIDGKFWVLMGTCLGPMCTGEEIASG